MAFFMPGYLLARVNYPRKIQYGCPCAQHECLALRCSGGLMPDMRAFLTFRPV